jgi:hypothetical protein
VALDMLAASADLTVRLGRDLTDAELDRADSLLADASAAVRSYTRQEIAQRTSVERLLVQDGWVRLQQRPVVDVASVADLDANDLAVTWDGADRVWLGPASTPFRFDYDYPAWGCGFRVDVTYTHGYDPVPDDIVSVVCGIVLRAMGGSPMETGLQSESIGSYSYTVGAAAAAGGLGMLPAERGVLDAYRRPVGVIYTS